MVNKRQATFIIIDRTESLKESFFKDSFSLTLLGFIIWLSQGSTWWTLVTGLLFILFLFGRIYYYWKQRHQDITSRQELIDYANSLEWPNESAKDIN